MSPQNITKIGEDSVDFDYEAVSYAWANIKDGSGYNRRENEDAATCPVWLLYLNASCFRICLAKIPLEPGLQYFRLVLDAQEGDGVELNLDTDLYQMPAETTMMALVLGCIRTGFQTAMDYTFPADVTLKMWARGTTTNAAVSMYTQSVISECKT
jgi:hypothetical protein